MHNIRKKLYICNCNVAVVHFVAMNGQRRKSQLYNLIGKVEIVSTI